MILYEFEGKELLENAGIKTPKSQLLDSPEVEITIPIPLVLKAQVLSGKRADAGGIIVVEKQVEIKEKLVEILSKEINKEKIEQVLVEEKVEYSGPEYYVSLSYDTEIRGPILTVSSSGGTGVEGRESKSYPIDPITQSVISSDNEKSQDQNLEISHFVRDDIISKLLQLFFHEDMLLLEINPLVRSGEEWVTLDAKVKLDDSASGKHEDWNFPPRSAPGHNPTENEIEAKKIDEGDYRGVAGSTYFDLDGDIAILSSGGGVSLTAMDALITAGGKPANFTEYSGNPPKEKVTKLTKVVLNKHSLGPDGPKPNIHGLWVIGTVAANFTDIYETLTGFIEGLRELKSQGIKLDFPIVIRRGGPRDQEAFEMLRQVKDFNLILQGEETSITQSAKVMAEEAKKYVITS